MAERFIGMTVALTLSNNAQLKGTVSKVDSATQILHLHDVTFLPSGAMMPDYSIEASHISSLEIAPGGPAQVQPSISIPPPAPAPAPAQQFHDPAILSFSRKPSSTTKPPQHVHSRPLIPSPKMPSQPMMQPPTMIRTASQPRAPLLPDLDSLTINPSSDPPLPMPGILPHPNLLRPKPRKPPPPLSSPPNLVVPSPQPKRKPQSSRRHRAHSRVSDSGWLTDEIVGGQVDDFDFQTNLTKFDKRRDWEEFRKLDTTDPTSLLVWNNRTATAPKYENLSHKMNVLDSVESSDESADDEQPVRRGSRVKRGTTSRKTSGIGQQGGASVSRNNSTVGGKWRVVGEEGSEIVRVAAEQMTNAEKLALEGGMSEDVLIENAARGIAEAVLTSLGAKRLDKKNHNPAPLVVVLAGNNRTGAYSLGAGRWLSIRGIRVLAVTCTSEGEELEIIRTQSKLFKNAGGRIVVPGDLQRTTAALPSPPEMVLDGLFGYLHSFDDLWDDEDKLTCVQLIKWANGQRGRRISIDKPAAAKDSEDDVDVSIAAEWIIEVGALKEDVLLEKGTRVFVVDLGLGKSVWRGVGVVSQGGKRRKGDLGITWGGKWAVEVELVV